MSGGHDALLAWIDEHGSERTIGIEGSGSYGAGLARRLIHSNDRYSRCRPLSRTESARSDRHACISIASRLGHPQGELVRQGAPV